MVYSTSQGVKDITWCAIITL